MVRSVANRVMWVGKATVFLVGLAVGSPFINNSAIVATATPPDNFNQNCPEGYRDAAVRTYASQTGAEVPVSFKIVFR